jgi:hypothetical protein
MTVRDEAGSIEVRSRLEERDVALYDALGDHLAATTPRRVPLDELIGIAAGVDPDVDAAPDQRARLAAVLLALEETGGARLPGRARWDRTGSPALPIDARGPATERVAAMVPVPPDLRPELSGARSLGRVSRGEIDALRAVNAWLRDFDRRRPVVPSRERSLEVFGDEKRLDVLAGGRLFREGVLGFDFLACEPVHPPFVFDRIGRGEVLLVVENHHTYTSAVQALRQIEAAALGSGRGAVGAVAYGAGHMFEASVTYIADLVPAPTRTLYFGDLDEPGLAIPGRADKWAREAGLPGVEPAAALYRALLACTPRPGRRPVPAERAQAVAGWLPQELGAAAIDVLAAGQRIPQEAVGLEALSALIGGIADRSIAG